LYDDSIFFICSLGGALITSPNENITNAIGKMYAGRASASPHIDLFITLLSMGLDGYKHILKERKSLTFAFREGLDAIAKNYGERLLACPRNTISFGITLNNLGDDGQGQTQKIQRNNDVICTKDDEHRRKAISFFGSMLFTRSVSGARVIPQGQSSKIGNELFRGYGSSTDEYGCAYLTAACAIGLTQQEMDSFFHRLDRAFQNYTGSESE